MPCAGLASPRFGRRRHGRRRHLQKHRGGIVELQAGMLRIPLLAPGVSNVNPGLINPWLINRGVSPFSGDSSLLEGTPP